MVSHAAPQQGSSGSGHGCGGAHNSGGHGHGSAGHGSGGHGKAEKKERSHTPAHGGHGQQQAMPGTPSRREERERHKAEKAVQDPDLKDYVRCPHTHRSGTASVTSALAASSICGGYLMGIGHG